MSIIRIEVNDIAKFCGVCKGLTDEGVTFTALPNGGYWEIEIKS